MSFRGRRPRNSQPQENVGIDVGKPSSGAVHAYAIASLGQQLNGSPLTAYNGAIVVPSPAGLAWDLSASTAYVDLGAVPTTTEGVSFVCIGKQETVNTFMWSTRTGSTSGFELLLGAGGAGTAQVRRGGNISTPQATGLNDGRFHAYAGSWDANELTLTVDGVHIGAATGLATQAHTQNLFIGRRGSTYANGAVAMLSLFLRPMPVWEQIELTRTLESVYNRTLQDRTIWVPASAGGAGPVNVPRQVWSRSTSRLQGSSLGARRRVVQSEEYRDRTSQPSGVVGANPYWVARGLKSLYLLAPGVWQVEQVTGKIGGTVVGSGPFWSGGKLRVDGTTANYVELEHGLPTSLAAPLSMVVGCVNLAGSGTSWGVFRNNALTSGWTMEATGEVYTYVGGSISGSLSLGGDGNVAFSHRSTSDLSGASKSVFAQDTSASNGVVVLREKVSLGVSYTNAVNAGAESVFTHFATFDGQLTNDELVSLANNPWQLFAKERIIERNWPVAIATSKKSAQTAQPQGVGRLNVGAEYAGSLKAWLPGNGSFYDAAGPGLNLTVTGTPAFGRFRDSRLGDVQALVLDGVDDEVSRPFPLLSRFSMLAWVYVDHTLYHPNSDYYAYIRRGGVFENDSMGALFIRGSSSFRRAGFYGRSGSSLRGLEATVSLSNGAWHRIAATFDGSTYRIYADGVQIGSTASGAGTDGGQPLAFGGLGDTVNNARGKGPAFDLRVYDVALPAEFFANDYANPWQLFTPRKSLIWTPTP